MGSLYPQCELSMAKGWSLDCMISSKVLQPLSYPTLFCIFRAVNESPHWLYSRGRSSEAQAILTKLAKWNKRPPLSKVQLSKSIDSDETEKQVKEGCLDVFKYCKLVGFTAVVMFSWWVSDIYGLIRMNYKVEDDSEYRINALGQYIFYWSSPTICQRTRWSRHILLKNTTHTKFDWTSNFIPNLSTRSDHQDLNENVL